MKFKPPSARPTMALAGGAAAGVAGATGVPIAFEAYTHAIIIAGIGVAIIIANIIIISAFLNFKALVPGLANEVINYYLLSLAVADLLCGALVVPLSVYPAIIGTWYYGETVCRVVGYIEVTLWSVSVFTFMWISVDRYLAVRKPLRYETVMTVQTRTRCQCWMVFTWISSAMLCCPPLLGFNEPVFDPQTYICMLDWGSTAAYTATLIVMVMGPSVISVVHNYYYIFAMMRKIRSGVPIHDKEYATALAENLSNPTHMMSFVLVLTFALSWGPYTGVRIYEYFNGGKLQIPFLHFGVVWLGIMNSFWKIIILFTLSPQFRLAFRILCLSVCCRGKGRLQAILIGLDQDD